MLSMAREGLDDAVSSNPHRRRPGLMNLITYGRSVTLAIQTMKNTDPAFAEWWRPYQERMKADPLMKWFNDRRVEIVHEGELKTGNYTVIGREGPVDLGAVMRELNRHAPPNTISTFLGDQFGGNGWEVRMPNGSTSKVYFDLPPDTDIESGLEVHDPPGQHDGVPIADTSIANLGRLYVAALSTIVDDFVARFTQCPQRRQ